MFLLTVYLYLRGSLQKWIAHFLLIRSKMERLTEITTFWVGNTTLYSTFLIRQRFQKYRCKSGLLQLSQFVCALSYSAWDVFNNFLLIDATDRSKISSDQKRFFIALSLYPISVFANTPFKGKYLYFLVYFRILYQVLKGNKVQRYDLAKTWLQLSGMEYRHSLELFSPVFY